MVLAGCRCISDAVTAEYRFGRPRAEAGALAQGARMPVANGHNLPLSPPRRFICDLLRHARAVPTIPVERRMHIAAALEARQAALHRPSWCTIFTKAYALVAAARPELRRTYIPFPWPHLYEHPHSVASIALERRWGDEDAVLFAHLRAPEKQDLLKLDRALRRYKQAPVDGVGLFRRIVKLTRLPWPLRRLAWWATLSTSGYRRARQMGTFGVSVYSALGCESLRPLSPLTTTLNYGVIGRRGSVTVRLIYDHRVLDGSAVARALQDLEAVLNGPLAAELRELAHPAEARDERRGAREDRQVLPLA